VSAAVLDRPRTTVHRTTLEGAITRVWEDLVAHHPADCPVCGGHMEPRYGASGPAPVGGRCTDCGSTMTLG
jgi:tRNA(Ile2) C34 agmatinyltransferase TiaS